MEKSFFNIEDSLKMYGVASMMLVFHHLYCDPDRLHQDYFTIIPSRICVIIAVFCHLCVAVYSYITGYGFSEKFDRVDESSIKRLCITYRIIVNSLVRFLLKYWIVLSVFLLTGIILGKIDFNIPVFFRSILGLSNEYNNEWWYVKQYIKMLIMLPFIDYVYVFVRKCIKDKKYFVPAVVCGGGISSSVYSGVELYY